ncbi:tRNA lysidine(34) synthetase TilS [Staphylococcus massiliensis]|uniref:tRNA lysidine(34) synthetase TilS n=1 Tax=Staphylococcus massiliensis TaxID=555791 RepID=UPI001EDE9C4E|nr:tRNA lysidine(34) synthetase TilS [Staphylococcus massiliensis]MCG3413193.1 tRNA lysidine(34) synthetase TilS [Staphylococcus massiliensis]
MDVQWNHNHHIVVAVSTGIDSMVLLHQLLTSYRNTYHTLTCLHVNHGVREASREEASFLKAFCEKHHVPLYTHQLDLNDVVEQGNSIQHIAREARYAWFDDMMRDLNADFLLTAHHEDDQIETIFYRLMTGRSTRSSLAIKQLIPKHGYHISRPLLHTRKDALKRYQARYKVPFYEDASNASNQYVRNDIRNRILPEIESNPMLSPSHLLKLHDFHEHQRAIIHQEARRFIDESVTFKAQDIEMPRQAFSDLDSYIKMHILDTLLHDLETGLSFSEKAYHEWFHQLETSVSQIRLHTTDEWIIQISYDKFVITTTFSNEDDVLIVKHHGEYDFGGYRIMFDQNMPDAMFPFTIRTRRTGDKVQIHDGKHKKVTRLMIDYKIPTHLRASMPIVSDHKHQIVLVGNLYLHKDLRNLLDIRKLGAEK